MQRYGFGLLLGLKENKMDKKEDIKCDFIVMKQVDNWKVMDYNETITRLKSLKNRKNIKKVLINEEKCKKN